MQHFVSGCCVAVSRPRGKLVQCIRYLLATHKGVARFALTPAAWRGAAAKLPI
jgi:hypothetical protein